MSFRGIYANVKNSYIVLRGVELLLVRDYMRHISILDCTLRDGGFALEDAHKNGIMTNVYTNDVINKLTEYIVDSSVEIIEIGAIEETDVDKKCFAIYQSVEEISQKKPLSKKQMVAGFFRGPDIDINSIPCVSENTIDIARVCLRYSELEKSLDFSSKLCKKGYKVFLQPMVTVRYNIDEIRMVLKAANEMKAYAVYFVDSYGYMNPTDVEYYFNMYDSILDPEIRIGFHAHNNSEMALLNTVKLIEIKSNREIIIDSCLVGMGQGTGNLQTEIICNYLNDNLGCCYNMESIFKACNIVDSYNVNHLWGYYVPRYIAAKNKTAYKYAMALKDKYGCDYSEIDNALNNMPEELRYRYTENNIVELLHIMGK